MLLRQTLTDDAIISRSRFDIRLDVTVPGLVIGHLSSLVSLALKPKDSTIIGGEI
ncbi:hypothetical protein [Myxacorys almedinensis]|uniref:Uncharacterized protein n=1 Tax=Myxacorys almedinensis A TaxID=2690445 RepID=A0A8J8CGJ0_9CYAN|nr:hypothetical protein [Myxacorys almedinensis]NDJ15798.1 hypothetical protein [Myxacorys almedinensis A]